jgi:hypothetical protein
MDTLEEHIEPIMSDTSEEEQENVIEKPKRVRKPLTAEQKEALVKRLADARAKKKEAKNKEFVEKHIENEVIDEVVKPVKIPKAKAVKKVETDVPTEPKKPRSPRKPKAEPPTTIITNNYYEKPVEEKKAKAPRKPREPKTPKAEVPPQILRQLPQPPPAKTLVFV